jgi:phospholipase C
MQCRTTLATQLLNGFAALTVFMVLLTGVPPTVADGPATLQDQDLDAKLHRIGHIIVIYQENWSFDALYGQFPGADGLQNGFDTLPQKEQSTSYASLIYMTPAPLTNGAIDPQFPSVDGQLALSATQLLPLPLLPYDFTTYIAPTAKTGDLIHRFYHEQLQIDTGVLEPKQGDLDKFVTWSDNPGLVLSYLDATPLPEGQLAQQYTLCDRFFHSAYGGSFLNHHWLIAAATPPWTAAMPSGFPSSWDPATRLLNDANLTFDGRFVVNTTQPLLAPFAPNTPPAQRLLINNTDPSQPGYVPTIGNRLDDAGINWRWYAGGWTEALANNVTANAALFQFHHQPFAYYTKYAPFLTAPTANYASADPATAPALNPATTGPQAHLQDETTFLADVAAGTLPPVSFVKPIGANNEHPGYADVVTGQQHVADLVQAVQHSPIWKDCVIIITYDENGGRWDHVVPPVRPDGWGVGVRVPGILISPFVRQGGIDSHEYETVSILKLIERRFHLAPLAARDAQPAVSDLTTAFDFDHDHD